MATFRGTEVQVKEFMGKGLVSAYRDSTIGKAVQLMYQMNVGSVVVVDSLGPCGTLTERDLIKPYLRSPNPEVTTISEVVSPTLESIDAADTMEHAARMMNEKKGRLVVFEDDEAVGVVTPTDLVRAIGNNAEDFGIDSVMSKKVLTVLPPTPVETALKEMGDRRVGSLMTGDERPEGIFTERDFVRKVMGEGRNRDTPVNEVATRPLVVAEIGSTGKEVAQIMTEHRIRRVPLGLSGTILGMVTARDLIEAYTVSLTGRKSPISWSQWN